MRSIDCSLKQPIQFKKSLKNNRKLSEARAVSIKISQIIYPKVKTTYHLAFPTSEKLEMPDGMLFLL